ncbi:MAG: hypothetical protein FD130_2226 [Halothiobacillaceae bacterium]|nr:MAG: hypothetical protein FD130_2226 [Halothiobacillaceae bacterium]
MESKSPTSSLPPVEEGPAKGGWKLKATEIIDMVVKLVPAAAVVATALIANNFQASMSTTNLLSQREQADSTLRADMFKGLITPILGSQKDNGIPVDREQLMVELLALNFHESFELKPIMLHVENRLVQEQSNKINHTGQTPQQSLRSIANRVLQRQLAAITKVESNSTPGQQACIYRIDLEGEAQATGAEESPSPPPCSTIKKTFKQLIEVPSPNGAYTLHLQIEIPKGKNLDDQLFQAAMIITGNKSTKATAKYDFLLTRLIHCWPMAPVFHSLLTRLMPRHKRRVLNSYGSRKTTSPLASAPSTTASFVKSWGSH